MAVNAVTCDNTGPHMTGKRQTLPTSTLRAIMLAERDLMIATALAAEPSASDLRIAAYAGASPKTVQQMRQAIAPGPIQRRRRGRPPKTLVST